MYLNLYIWLPFILSYLWLNSISVAKSSISIPASLFHDIKMVNVTRINCQILLNAIMDISLGLYLNELGEIPLPEQKLKKYGYITHLRLIGLGNLQRSCDTQLTFNSQYQSYIVASCLSAPKIKILGNWEITILGITSSRPIELLFTDLIVTFQISAILNQGKSPRLIQFHVKKWKNFQMQSKNHSVILNAIIQFIIRRLGKDYILHLLNHRLMEVLQSKLDTVILK